MENKDTHKSAEKSAVAAREEEILKFWRDNDIFRKSLEKPSPKGNYVFYDGPPFATGLPHFGHMLPTTIKDAIPRFRTMQGYHVMRRWGWDCHGLPIENLIEKELGLDTKKDIEEYGIEKFNVAARGKVLQYADEWKEIIPRLGRWVDMENDYRTMDSSYTESVWWSWKQLNEKNLVYRSFKVMYICPRCETTLSNFEVNQGYKDIADISVYARFKVKNQNAKIKNIIEKSKIADLYLLAWTTTPWTLPGNVALAVKNDIAYSVVKNSKENGEAELVVIAQPLFEKLKGKFSEPEIVGELKGSDLVGTEYEPLFDYYANDSKLKNRENGWKVIAADFVTMEEGTGIVHVAPAFGAEDFEAAEKENLPFVQHVTMHGVFKPEVKDFAGLLVKAKDSPEDPNAHQATDIEIIKFLAAHGTLFAKEKITHSYPHCWRCSTPLLNYATTSWFVKVTALKDTLLKNNGTVSWVPEEIGEGRFGKWLDGARDWAVSRSRYWGAPLPVWICEKCETQEFAGSVDELSSKIGRGNTFVAMRHGESENVVKEITSSDNSVPSHLTDAGKRQVREAAEKLKANGITAIYASPLFRTKETAEIAADVLGLDPSKIIYDDRLKEINTGVYSGKPSAEYHALFKDYYAERFSHAPEGGETLQALKERAGEFLYDADAKHEKEKILVVSHEDTIWMLASASRGLTQTEAVALKSDKTHFLEPAETLDLDFKNLPHNSRFELDLHRPYIDQVAYPCSCGGEFRRVPEVFDTWYDSGSMPYAQNHYPFEKKQEFEQNNSPFFPADFIAEGLDQTRGWFYTLMVLNSALFGQSPYKNVIVNGLILAEDGRKMSKSLRNYPDLMETVNVYGADSLRYFLVSSPAVRAEEVAFSPRGVDEVMKKNVMRLGNVIAFYEMYKDDAAKTADPLQSPHILDRWILARLAETAAIETAGFERYELDRASRPLADFIDDLSTWYIRRSRDRFKSDDAPDRDFVRATAKFVLIEFSKLLAPFMPFTAEDTYRRAGGEKESVHLEDWPEFGAPDADLLAGMSYARSLSSTALMERSKQKIKVRQPLASLTVKRDGPEPKYWNELKELVKDEINVKEVLLARSDAGGESGVLLDTNITPELKSEGMLRELVRAIQDMRKEAGFNPSDSIILAVAAEGEARLFLEENADALKKAVIGRDIAFGPVENGTEVALDEIALTVRVEKA